MVVHINLMKLLLDLLLVSREELRRSEVENWDLDSLVLKVGDPNGTFFEGENIVGEDSLASYTIADVPGGESLDKYEQNSFIETEADSIIDFSESNPFGQV